MLHGNIIAPSTEIKNYTDTAYTNRHDKKYASIKIECAEEGRNGHRIDSSRDNLILIK